MAYNFQSVIYFESCDLCACEPQGIPLFDKTARASNILPINAHHIMYHEYHCSTFLDSLERLVKLW